MVDTTMRTDKHEKIVTISRDQTVFVFFFYHESKTSKIKLSDVFHIVANLPIKDNRVGFSPLQKN